MTILDATNRRFYTGNGTATTYAINSLSGDALTGITIFKITDIKVYLGGVLQTYTTDYTITSDTPPSAFAGKLVNASVVFVTAPLASVEIAIVREVPYTQELGLSNGNNVPPKPLESQLDKLAVQTQQLSEALTDRVLRVEAFESSLLDPITVENGSYLKWDAAQLINATPIDVGVDISDATVTQVSTNTSNISTLLQNGTSPWSSGRTYVAGNVVGHSNDLWKCLVGNTNSAPSNTNTNWVRVITNIGTVYALPTNYSDIRINYTDANTVTLLAGSRVRSSDDTTDIIFSANQTCVLNASGANGLDTGSEAVSTWYHLYAIYNPTTLTSALVFSTVNEAVSGSITLPSGFTKKRQLKFSVRNDASSNILPFTFLQNGKILYRAKSGDGLSGWPSVTLTLGNGLTSTTYADVSCSSLIPPTARLGIFTGYSNAGDILYLKQKGSPSTDEVAVAQVGSTGVAVTFYGMEVATDASQVIQYKKSAGVGNIGLGCAGYVVTEVL